MTEAFLICIISVIFTAIGAALGIGYKNSLDLAAMKAWKHEHELNHNLRRGVINDN